MENSIWYCDECKEFHLVDQDCSCTTTEIETKVIGLTEEIKRLKEENSELKLKVKDLEIKFSGLFFLP